MFTYLRRAQYHETDKMGIIHHSNYVKWMEEARIAYLSHIGVPFTELEAMGIVSPVVSVSCEYKKVVEFDDEIEVRTSVLKYTGVKLILKYEMYNKTKGEISTICESSHCFMKGNRVVSLKKVAPIYDEKITSEN